MRTVAIAGLSLAALALSASPPGRLCIRASSFRMAVRHACAWRGRILIAGWRSLPDYRSARPVGSHLIVATLNPATLVATGRVSVATQWAPILLACTQAGTAYLGVAATVYRVRSGPQLEPTLTVPGETISSLTASGDTIAVAAGVRGRDKDALIVARNGRLIGGFRPSAVSASPELALTRVLAVRPGASTVLAAVFRPDTLDNEMATYNYRDHNLKVLSRGAPFDVHPCGGRLYAGLMPDPHWGNAMVLPGSLKGPPDFLAQRGYALGWAGCIGNTAYMGGVKSWRNPFTEGQNITGERLFRYDPKGSRLVRAAASLLKDRRGLGFAVHAVHARWPNLAGVSWTLIAAGGSAVELAGSGQRFSESFDALVCREPASDISSEFAGIERNGPSTAPKP